MKAIQNYLDSTYLKTAQQAQLSESENTKVVQSVVLEAIQEGFKLVMIRPDQVSFAKSLVQDAASNLLVGTVIDFPQGTGSLQEKLSEAQQAINNGADELDFVVNYEAFKNGAVDAVKEEVYQCTRLGLEHHKVVKFIIEVAALSDDQIIQLTSLIKQCVVTHFKESEFQKVFVKSSTGFFVTQNQLPNGATSHTISLMLENAYPLPVKAAGGVRTQQEAIEMIKLGVMRIGTSSAKSIAAGFIADSDY
ncbi:deoxyribose-phosphate aldolase [Flavobacterium sp.]|uniref:deoxyribose-phosphate aldolase n=1 Tax=Flavobacterium sp. TaxID=239 RepID=UPI003D137E65